MSRSRAAALCVVSGVVFSVVFAQIPKIPKLKVASGAKPAVEQLELAPGGDAKDPGKDRMLEHFRVNDPASDESIEMTISHKGECGMERKPGLGIESERKNLKTGYWYCTKKTNYLVMKMKNDSQKELLSETGSWKSPDGKSYVNIFLVAGAKAQARVEIKTSSLSKPVVKTYDFPFEVKPYEQTEPVAESVDKSLMKADEIDHFKVYDLTGEEWFRVQVQNMTCTMEKVPCLQFSIAHNNLGGYTHVMKGDLEKKLAGAKGGQVVIEEKKFENKGWGPGEQYWKITATKDKATVVLKTKTAGKELVKDYKIPW